MVSVTSMKCACEKCLCVVSLEDAPRACACACEALPEGSALPEGAAPGWGLKSD